jgi:hypothetical protein|tara:strand:- start:45 stop:422 length:378 start_codon:yes stop_codon:yes gene_type:complete
MSNNKKGTYVNIKLKEYNNFINRVSITDQPLGEIGSKYLHDGNVFIEMEDEEKYVQIDIDKNVFDLVIESYLYGDFIRSSSHIMRGQLIMRQKYIIKKLTERNEKLIKDHRENAKKIEEKIKGVK